MASSPLAFIGNVVTLGFTGAEYSRGETIRLGDATIILPTYNSAISNSTGYWNNLLASLVMQELHQSYPECIFAVRENTVILISPPSAGAPPYLGFDNHLNAHIGLTLNAPTGLVDGVNYGSNPWRSFSESTIAPKITTLGFTGGEFARGETVNIGGVSVTLPIHNLAISTSTNFWNVAIAEAVKQALNSSVTYASCIIDTKENTVIVVAPAGLDVPELIFNGTNNAHIAMTLNAPSGIVNGVNYGLNPWGQFLTNFNETLTLPEDASYLGKLSGADVDGNTLTFAKVGDPSHGALTINAATGAYTYTPATNFNGTDSFAFKVNDGTVDSAAATVSITVNAVNDAPVGLPQIKEFATLTASDINNAATQKFNGTNSHIYEFVNTAVTWQTAKTAAESKSINGVPGYLVTITSADEQAFVDGYVNQLINKGYDGKSVWLGASDAAQEGVWKWVVGPEAGTHFWSGTSSGSSVGGAYSNWLGHLDNHNWSGEYANYAILDRLYAGVNWDDMVNSVPSAYVIEYSASVGPTTASSFTEDKTLYADASSVSDVDGIGTISYRWQRSSNGAVWANIDGATNNAYTLNDADVGQYIRLAAQYTDGNNTLETVYSSTSSQIINVNDAPTGSVSVALDGMPITNSAQATYFTLNDDSHHYEFIAIQATDGTKGWLNGESDLAGGWRFALQTPSLAGKTIASAYTLEHTEAVLAASTNAATRLSAVRSEFGSTASLSGFEEVQEASALVGIANIVQFLDLKEVNLSGIPDYLGSVYANEGPFVTYQGQTNWSGSSRQFFIAAHDGVTPADWAVHGSIDNAQIDLGSWIYDRQVLAKVALSLNAEPTPAPAQGQTLTTASTLADADGMAETNYQWLADGVNIPGETANTLTLTQSQVGKAISVRATYTDGNGTAETQISAATPAVLNVNDAPLATAAANSTNEDTTKTGTLSGTDIDGDTLTFAKVADPTHGTVTINAATGAYTYTPAKDFNGTDSFTFKVNDGTVDSATATISITVNAVNDAPIGLPQIMASTKLTEADVLNPTNQKFNAANAHIYEFVGSTVPWLDARVAAESRSINGLPGYLVTITGSDENAFVSAMIPSTIAWIGASDAESEGVWKWVGGPEAGQQFWSGGKSGASVGGAYSHWDSRWQPDNYRGNQDYAWLIGDESQSAFSLWDDAQNDEVLLGWFTADGLTAGYVIEYSALSENTPAPSSAFAEDKTLYADASGVSDAEGVGTVSYRWQRSANGSAWADITGATNKAYTLNDADVGQYIRLATQYRDGNNTLETVYSSASAQIANVNDTPIATSIDLTIDEDIANTGILTGADIDSDSLTFTKVADPSHGSVTINAVTGAYTYTPAANFNGTDSFTFKVNDGTVDSPVATLSITVAAVNDRPTTTATLQNLSTKEGANFSFKLPDGLFTDVDAGDSLTLSALGLPAGLNLETTNGEIWIKGSPAQASAGSYAVTLKASDTAGLSVENTLALSVAPDGVGINVKPVMWGSDTAFSQLNVDLLPVGNLSNELFNLNITVDKKLGTFEAKLSSNVAQPVGSFQFNLNAAADVVGNLQVTQNPALSNWTILKTGSLDSQKYVAYANSGQASDYFAKGQTILTLSGKLPSNLSAETLLSLSDMESGAATAATPLGWRNSESSSYSSASSGYVFSELGNNSYEIFASEASNIQAAKAFTANDALLALRLALGLTQTERTASPFELIAADINRDGRVSVFDAYAIAQKALGLAEAPPTEFVFLDANADLSGINRRSVNYSEGVSFAGHADGDYDVALVGVLLGDVNHSFVAV